MGRLVELRDKRWRKAQQVRIFDAEISSPDAGGNNVWFWAKYG